ncbi:DedA family protein [Streptomyces sp. NPDC059740]|uniref:DedA family protein n=1 Tax=Streptomyces sp. NPDC059740 TaxID=3346926 RepID=UPI003657F3A2
MGTVTGWLAGLSGAAVYGVVAALVFCEDALFVGFVLPGETAAVLGGVIASQHRVSVFWLAVVVVLAAIVGDSVGYEIGRRLGPRLRELRPLQRHRHGIEGAERLIRRRGPAAVFLGRFIAVFRALMPALAGASRMHYPLFLLFNALGGLVWGVGCVLLGYFAGSAYEQVEREAGGIAAVVVAVVVVAALVAWRLRRRRQERSSEDGGPESGGQESGARGGGAPGTGGDAGDGSRPRG